MKGNNTKISSRIDSARQRMEAKAEDMMRLGIIGFASIIEFPEGERLQVITGQLGKEQTAPITTSSLYKISSQTKMFTAAAMVLLEKDGKLSFDDVASAYVDGLPTGDADRITIEQMLNHTNGMGDFVKPFWTFCYPWPSFTDNELMALARSQGRQFEPGAKYQYGNTGYLICSHIVKKLSGKTLPEFIRQRILLPLDMNNTFFGQTGEWPRDKMVKGYYIPAQGYEGDPIDASQVPDLSYFTACGDMISNLDDMLKWAGALVQENTTLGCSLPDLITENIECGLESELGWFDPVRYGRGFESFVWGGRPVWGHRGMGWGYMSATFIDPVTHVRQVMFISVEAKHSWENVLNTFGHELITWVESGFQVAADIIELP
jgi:D-alanyl-D-alanine carboxypeptidase